MAGHAADRRPPADIAKFHSNRLTSVSTNVSAGRWKKVAGLVDMGMVALPVPVDGKCDVRGIPFPFGSAPARADMLVLVEAEV